jgi:chemotaxis protein histidine kinase CheA
LSEWDPDELRELRAFFLDEADEHLGEIAAELARLGAQAGDGDVVTSLLRLLHTLKGSAGSVELPDVARAAHAIEDRLVALRAAPSPGELSQLPELESDLTRLRSLVEAARVDVRGDSRPNAIPMQLASPADSEPHRDRRAIERTVPGAAETVRVEVERIDELLDAASELVLDRARIARRLQDVQRRAETLNDPELSRLALALHDDLEGLRRTSATLQDRIRRVRVVEIGRLFARLQQPARELARKEGKEVALVTLGEEVEIDKALVERVAEPLLHLLRNAVAHGIEPPEVRRALGKDAAGVVSLTARRYDDALEIIVSDDGQGIDLIGVRRALVAAGRVGSDEAAALDEASLFAALFEPGVSTRVAADDLAGRGVGLDAVRAALSRLHGSVSVTSRPGQGAAFTVRLPVNAPVQEALLFKVGGQVYAVPAARVEETLDITPADIDWGHQEKLRVRDKALPLVRLGALLGVPPPPGANQRRSALVMSAGEVTFAVTCDKVIGPRDIVVRSLGPLLTRLPLYAGATISGAGKVQLLLDVAQLAQVALRGVRGDRPAHALGPRRVLVVDDSRSIREAASLILAQGGFACDVVSDGWDAWELLQDRPFDALVTDLEMPRLDGWELIARVRRERGLGSLPIVVVSSRAEATRARVMGAGADAVVDKPLRRKVLLDALADAISARAAKTAPRR